MCSAGKMGGVRAMSIRADKDLASEALFSQRLSAP